MKTPKAGAPDSKLGPHFTMQHRWFSSSNYYYYYDYYYDYYYY